MRLCIQWPRFGPYHLARLHEAHNLLGARGVEVIGLETAGNDALYDWRVEEDTVPFRREQVFPGQTFEDISPAAMHVATIEALDRLAPDAVGIMSYGYPDARAAVAWCRKHRKVAILMTDSKADDAVRIGWRERVKQLIIAQYDAALVAGTPHRDYLRQLGFSTDRIFFGYDVVDNAFFREGALAAQQQPARHRHLPGLDEDTPYFLAVNRFLPFKNLSTLLRAYGIYAQRAAAPWRLLLIGDGPERPQLEEQVRENGLEGVTFCGFRQLEDLPVYYGRAGAFVHPTLKDTWGLVVNEAMAAGLPVLVSTKAGCTADLVVDGETGFAFAPHDEDQLAAQLETVAAPTFDRDRMGRHAQQHIERLFPLSRFAEELLHAAEAGQQHAQRRSNLLAQTLLTVLNRGTKDVTAFHSADL